MRGRLGCSLVGSIGAVALTTAGLASSTSSAGAAVMPLYSSGPGVTGYLPDAATVPAGICSVTISADGGHGGHSSDSNPLSAGGAAANVTATVSVTPGEVLSVQVAGAGQDAQIAPPTAVGGPGGGGGGNPGDGAGGGGASAVAGPSGPLLVAGGGGGGSFEVQGGVGGTLGNPGGPGDGPGGGQGGSVAGGGGDAVNLGGAGGGVTTGGTSPAGGNGGAGTGTVGGGGGAAFLSLVPRTDGGRGAPRARPARRGMATATAATAASATPRAATAPKAPRAPGAEAVSGSQAAAAAPTGAPAAPPGMAPGRAVPNPRRPMSKSAGGGGSSHLFVAATNVSSLPSTRSGDGQVTITFDPTADSCPTPAAAVTVAPEFTG